MVTATELVLVLGVPLLLMVVFTLLLEHQHDNLPEFLRRLSHRQAMVWNIGVGVIIALSALRYVMTR